MNNLLSKIHQGECEKLIPTIPDNSVDIVITSPPYNVDLGNNKHKKDGYDLYQDNKKHKDFISWLANIFLMLKPKMVYGGRICINIGDGHNGAVPTHSDIIQFMTKDLGYLLKGTIIWNKNQHSNRSSWGSWMSPSNPSFPTPFEFISIFCNESQRKKGNKEDITLTKNEFVQNSSGIWTIKPETNLKKIGHPAPFPLELPYRLIQQLSYRNDIVLDIFAGTGTTCLAAEMLERRWFGFELSEKYAKRANERLQRFTDQNRLKF